MVTQILAYWPWVLLVVSVLMYKFIFRVFFGLVIVPENKIGLVTKKFVLFGENKQLSGDRIIAVNGEAGFQAKMLETGLHWWMWPWQYSVDMQGFIVIPEGHIGLVSSKDGKVPQTGRILGRRVESDNFQDAVGFLNNGGQKGRQSAYITNGSYKINTFLFEVSAVKQVSVPYKVTEEIGKGNVKIMPDLLINGGGQGGNGSLDGLLGVQIMNMMGKGFKNIENETIEVPAEVVVEDKKGKK